MNYHKVPPKISRDPIEVQGQKHDQGKPMISLMEKAMEKYGAKVSGEHSGGSVSYYKVVVENPITPDIPPYVAECEDIISALEMNYSEGNILKALWRSAAARQGKVKKSHDAKYDAEKILHFAQSVYRQKLEMMEEDENDKRNMA